MKSNEEFWQRYYTQSKVNDSDKFGRMFPMLSPFPKDTEKVRSALMELGKKGGIMDNDSANLDNPRIPSGFTFFGQFVDHDITFDPTSSFEHQNDPKAIENFRTPVLELDNIYGGGPIASPQLYDITTGGIKFLIDKNFPNDVPRNSQNTALMADPRNDENLIISQLHLAFLKFHNAVLDRVISDGITAPFEAFAEAQRLVRWHYQWIVLHEYLPLIVGKSVIRDILENGRNYYKYKNKPYIPVEFAMAAFRIGHSQVRPFYKVNSQFSAPIFNSSQDQSHPDPDDLRGGKRAARRFVEWSNFFSTGTGIVQQGKKIDTTISSPLFELPFVPEPKSLAQRNLLRGLSFGLPSGQDIAKEMFIRPLLSVNFSDVAELGFHRKTPLWFYILREAQIKKDGTRLGPVGGRIVAEVMIGLLQGDGQSFLRQSPDWKPVLGNNGKFKMVDLLEIAGVE